MKHAARCQWPDCNEPYYAHALSAELNLCRRHYHQFSHNRPTPAQKRATLRTCELSHYSYRPPLMAEMRDAK